jgi:hypothetical protein
VAEPQIFDYVNVQSTYNATFNNTLPNGYLEQARVCASTLVSTLWALIELFWLGSRKLARIWRLYLSRSERHREQ